MRRVSTLMIIILLISQPVLLVKSQPNYFIGLNMEVEFRDKGVVRVTLKQHPFDAGGTSLISNSDIVDEMIADEESMVSLMLLFFTSTPSKTVYRLVSRPRLEPSEQVFCNTGTPGLMKRFDGAITLAIELLLNTTGSLIRMDEDTYRVVVVDYFAVTDPRSWIDVIDFRFAENVKLLNFSSDPSWAKPPSTANATRLEWLNMNEVDAPDNYVITLKIPGVVFSKPAYRLKAEISGTMFSKTDSSILVKVRNTGDEEGVFIIVFSEGVFDQARKAALAPGEEEWIRFPVHVEEGEEVTVRVFWEKEQLDEDRIMLGAEAPLIIPVSIISVTGMILIVFGVFSILLQIKNSTKKHPPPEGAPPPAFTPS